MSATTTIETTTVPAPRRPSSGAVLGVFLRIAEGRLLAEATAQGLKAETEEQAGLLLAEKVKSLDEFAALTINLTEGKVDPADLTMYMREAFPHHRIGDRHGPHYASLARTGDLSPKSAFACRFAPQKATRKARGHAAALDLSGVDPKKMAALEKAAKGTPLEAILAAAKRPE